MIGSLAIAMTLLAFPQAGTRASDGRSYVTRYFAMELDGIKCGLIQKFEGGDIETNVSPIPTANEYLVSKQIGNVKYNDFQVSMPLTMGKPVHDWIEAALMTKPTRKSGEIKAADFKRDVRHIREFKDALITEIGFPSCDASSKEPAFMTLKFQPWIVRNKKRDGSKVDNPADMAQKQWHPTDFRFVIDGLDTSKITKVDKISIKQTVVRSREGLRVPGRLEYPNIAFYVPAEFAKPFYDWHKAFVIDSKSAPAKHKSGSLVYLNRTRQKELMTISLSGLGIYKISSAPRSNNEDKIDYVKVEMTCGGVRMAN